MTMFVIATLTALLVTGALLIGGFAVNKARQPASRKAASAGYICPLTGEELPCPKCCPLNQE